MIFDASYAAASRLQNKSSCSMPTSHAVGSYVSPLARLITLAAFALTARVSIAQEDPFGAAAKAVGAPKVDVPPGPAKREPLVIELLRRSNPTTAEQLVAAAQTALQFGRPDEAKAYLSKLLEIKPSDEALAPLAARYGD